MRRLAFAATTLMFSALSVIASADTIPYANQGFIAPTQTLTATSTGSVLGYFVQGGALSGGNELYTDFVRMLDITSGFTSAYLFNSQTTPAGTVSNFGPVTAGDKLVFQIYVQNLNQTFASTPAYSVDNFNHLYITSFAGGTLNSVSLPAGLYAGFEDTNVLTNNNPGNLNFNDISAVFTNVTASPSAVPEPGSLALLSTGTLAALGMLRRKLSLS